MKNKYTIQVYQLSKEEWVDYTSFASVLEAVEEYKFLTNEHPSLNYRFIEVHAIER